MDKVFSRNKIGMLGAAFIRIAMGVAMIVMPRSAHALEGKPFPVTPSTENPAPTPAEAVSQASGPLEKAPDEFNPLETPEQRALEEWERLGIIPESSGNQSGEAGKPGAEPAPKEPELVHKDEMAPQAPHSGDEPAVSQFEGADQQLLGDKGVPARSGAEAVVIRPDFMKAALRFDNDEGPSVPEDPDDPTSKGDRKHGEHKGAKVLKLDAIPVIKMGENREGRSGFKVIKRWNS